MLLRLGSLYAGRAKREPILDRTDEEQAGERVSTSVYIVGVGPNFLRIGRPAVLTCSPAAILPRDRRATERGVSKSDAFFGGAEWREQTG
jgi:hypothetical protein